MTSSGGVCGRTFNHTSSVVLLFLGSGEGGGDTLQHRTPQRETGLGTVAST